MTDEEFKKAMTKTVIFIVVMLIILIVLGVFVFNQSGKSTSIFESEEQRKNYENSVNKMNESDISDEEVNQIDGSQEFVTEGEESISTEVPNTSEETIQ